MPHPVQNNCPGFTSLPHFGHLSPDFAGSLRFAPQISHLSLSPSISKPQLGHTFLGAIFFSTLSFSPQTTQNFCHSLIGE